MIAELAIEREQHLRNVQRHAQTDPAAAAWLESYLAGTLPERRGAEERAWRREVFERDGYRCRHCGSTKGLQAHHIEPWALAPELRLDVDNGLTVCVDCHVLEHPELEVLIRSAARRG